MPHSHCFLWRPDILWLNVLSDATIALSYFSIPILITYVLRKRPDITYRGVFVLFSLFIFFCGITHLFSIYTTWTGAYGWHGLLKGATALVSLTTACYLAYHLKAIIGLPTPQQFHQAKAAVEDERLQRHRLEEESERLQFYRDVTRTVSTGLLVVNQEQTIVMTNDALDLMLGYAPRELEGQALACLVDMDSQDHHSVLVGKYMDRALDAHAMAEGRAVNARKKNGDTLAVEVRLNSSALGGAYHTIASVIDLEATRRDLLESVERDNRLRRAVHGGNDGVWEWNLKTNGVWYNHTLKHMIGLDAHAQETLDDWLNHIHEDDRDRMGEVLRQHLEEGALYDVVYRCLCGGPNPDYRWVRAKGETIRDDSNEPVLMSGTLVDVHETKQLQQQLAESNQALERFAMVASHDFREPLRKISMFSSLLREQLEAEQVADTVEYEIDRIIDGAKRMTAMVDRLLHMAQIHQSILPSRTLTCVSALLQPVLDELKPEIEAKSATVTLIADCPCKVDEVSMQQVLTNLIVNSLNYGKTDEPLRVEIEARVQGSQMVLEIRDNGVGFTHDQAKLLFTPFVRLDSEATSGTGLGLAICRQVVRAHEGIIEAAPNPNGGAIFTIRLPYDGEETDQ